MQKVVWRLTIRSLVHDNSKLTREESVGFLQIFNSLHKNAYGTDAYKAELAKIQPVLKTHYSRNSHHPDHRGLESMTIYDLIEMTVDWRAAIRKQKGGSMKKSFEINKPRFQMSDELERILKTL